MSASSSGTPSEERLVGYLLGRLTQDEQERVEEFYLADAEHLELLLAAEDDLIDGYVRGELGARDRERFENFFLNSPGRRERVETARALDAFVKKRSGAPAPSRAPLTHPRFKRAAFWLPLAACLVLAAGCALLVFRERSARRDYEAAQARLADSERDRQSIGRQLEDARQREAVPTPEATPEGAQPQPTPGAEAPVKAPTPAPPAPATQPVVASLLLSAGAVRGSGATRTLVIGRQATQVRLLVQVSNQGYQSYEAVIRTAEGAEVWRGTVKSHGGEGEAETVALNPPARVFRSEDYTLSLAGSRGGGAAEAAGEYQFRVQRK
jgi:hypothetical protein